MRSRTFTLFALVALGVGLIVGSAAAQAGRGTGRINGTVVDEAGKAVPGAKVTIALLDNESVKREAVTDKKGEWAIIGLGTTQWTLDAAGRRIPADDDGHPGQTARAESGHHRHPEKGRRRGRPVVQDDATLILIEQAGQLFTAGNYDGALATLPADPGRRIPSVTRSTSASATASGKRARSTRPWRLTRVSSNRPRPTRRTASR